MEDKGQRLLLGMTCLSPLTLNMKKEWEFESGTWVLGSRTQAQENPERLVMTCEKGKDQKSEQSMHDAPTTQFSLGGAWLPTIARLVHSEIHIFYARKERESSISMPAECHYLRPSLNLNLKLLEAKPLFCP